jgi:predicted alpha/beta-hydrolase family hydrolase
MGVRMNDEIQMDGYSIEVEVERKPESRLNVVLAHGGNNNMKNSLIQKLFDDFRNKYSTLRFNFSFADTGIDIRNISDGSAVLRSTAELKKCIEYMGAKDIVLIGKSFGGYVSTLLAGNPNLGIKKVIALGYPLHKPGKPQELLEGLSQAHMQMARLQVEFIIGDSDPSWDIKNAPPILSAYKINIIENADHSFKPVRPGGSLDENEKKVVELASQIIEGIS